MGSNTFSKTSYKRLNWSYDQIKAATSLALKHRKDIKNGNFSSFRPALAFAIAKDIIDLFDIIIVTKFFGIFLSVYLFIFLWGKGKWKVRIVIFFLSCLDVIPIANMLPFQTICVLYAYRQAKKRAEKAKERLNALNVSFNNSL